MTDTFLVPLEEMGLKSFVKGKFGGFKPELHLRDPLGRFREMPEYNPEPLTFGGSAGGTTGARIAFHKDGSKWLVKTYQGHEDRVATELLSNAVYRRMGARAPRAGRIILHNGRQALAYPLEKGEVRHMTFHRDGPDLELRKHFMTDAYLANWDVAGLEDDNVLWDPQGQPFRVDQGGTLEFRAQGGAKEYGSVPMEVRSMLAKGGQSQRMVGNIATEEMRSQAAELGTLLTDEWIDAAVDAARFRSKGMRERVRVSLKGRRDWMRSFGAGEVGLP